MDLLSFMYSKLRRRLLYDFYELTSVLLNSCFLIATRIRNADKLSLLPKTLLSVSLMVLVIISLSNEKMVMLSIMFSSVADIFLGIHRIEKKSSYLFYIALILVTCSQICLLISSIHLTKFNMYSIFLAIIMDLILYYSFAKKCEMGNMQKISMIYSYIFLLVVSNVIFNIEKLELIYVFAVLVYWISDIVLFVQKFIAKESKNLLDGINKIMYYTAQMLFVLYIQN